MMNSYPTYLKFAGYLMAGLFIVAAVLQYNDPDSLPWVIIYGIAAVLTLLFLYTPLKWQITATATTVAFLGAGYLAYKAMQEGGIISSSLQTWQMQSMTEELAREAGGLFIISIWMLIMTFRLRKDQKVPV